MSTRLNFSARGEDEEFDQKSIEDHIDEIAEKKKERDTKNNVDKAIIEKVATHSKRGNP